MAEDKPKEAPTQKDLNRERYERRKKKREKLRYKEKKDGE